MSKKTTIDLPYLRSIKALVWLQGKEYLTHPGLLRCAHEQGIESITTDLVSWDAPKQAAVVKATARGARGTYTGYVDCNPQNTKLKGANLRMAETRAINRALRLYLGLGMITTEELPGNISDAPAAPPIPQTINEEVADIENDTRRRVQRFILTFGRCGVVSDGDKADIVEAASAISMKRGRDFYWQRVGNPSIRALAEESERWLKIASHNVVAWLEAGHLQETVEDYHAWKKDGSNPMTPPGKGEEEVSDGA